MINDIATGVRYRDLAGLIKDLALDFPKVLRHLVRVAKVPKQDRHLTPFESQGVRSLSCLHALENPFVYLAE